MDTITEVIKEIQSEINDNSITVNKVVQDAQHHCQKVIEDKIGKKEEEMEVEISELIQKLNEEAKARSDRINKFLKEKESAMDKLRKDTKKKIEGIVKDYNVKIEDAQKSVQCSFDKINDYYSETQANVQKIVEELSTEPQVMLERVKVEIGTTKRIFKRLQDENMQTLDKMQKMIEVHSKDTENNINVVAERNQKMYSDILKRFKKTVDK